MGPREPGQVLDGKYEILRPLGSGGMGDVHLVRHIHLQEMRVIKILRQDLASDPSAQARFLREARLATQIKHPNVAILYDYSRLEDGSFFMVWEHIEGQEIGDRLRRMGPFAVPAALQLGIQALRGLEAIHATGVIHRDISPDNLMITEDRRGQLRVKIIDLGLAKDLGPNPNLEITQAGTFMGKLQYCSPEQAGPTESKSLDRRSDLYSFGLVLYEMICGLPPFESESPHGFIFKRLSEDPLPLSGRNPAIPVPPLLDQVLRRALARDPDLRFPDAVSFILALEKVGAALSSAATQEVPIPPAFRAQPLPATQPLTPPISSLPPKPRSSSEMTREEKFELLAQIEKAALRSREGDQLVAKAQTAISAGQIDEAKAVIARIESSNPRAAGLDELKLRLANAETRKRERQAIEETERALETYLTKRQLPLARFALQSLLDLAPQLAERESYEQRIAALAESLDRAAKVSSTLQEGREALGRGDLREARRLLEILLKIDPERSGYEALRQELAAADREDRDAVDLAARRRRIEALLAAGKVEDAQRELDELARLGVPRVTVASFQERVDAVRLELEVRGAATRLDAAFRHAVANRDWLAAREAAQDHARFVPESSRSAEMYAEIDRLEAAHRREAGIEQGVRQVETFLAQGKADQAELALKIVVQLDPENRHRRRLERQIKSLKG